MAPTPIRQHLENRLQSAGLKPNDLPRAILIHELLGLLFLAFTWTSCYYLPPSQIPALKLPFDKMVSLIPTSIVTNTPSFIKGRVGSAYLESSCVRKVLRPLSIPAKMIITYNLVTLISTQEQLASSSKSSLKSASSSLNKTRRRSRSKSNPIILANQISSSSSS